MARIPTQEFVNPKTGERIHINHNDKTQTEILRHQGFKRSGGIKEDGCGVKYDIKTR